MARLDWLTARPIAHRGLHDPLGPVENTPAAFSAAIAGNYGIECDLQVSADGEAMVHHDDELGRLTDGAGRLADMPAAEIGKVRFKRGNDRILNLSDLCDLVAGRVTLVLELKSHFDGDDRLVRRVAETLAGYRGPTAAMSFDQAMVENLRRLAPSVTRGIVAQRRYEDWLGLSAEQKRSMRRLLHLQSSKPQFIAYSIRDLPALVPLGLRILRGMPLLTWTVRTEAERRRAAFWTDQIIFEGWRP